MNVGVYTDDKFLYRLIELELSDTFSVSPYSEGAAADVLIIDDDAKESPKPAGVRTLRLSRSEKDGVYKLPFPRGSLLAALTLPHGEPRLSLLPDEKAAMLDGRRIKLTAHEYGLLSVLISRGGDFISREEISRAVWGEASDGLINIYVHYLREKLETEGEKIIISSRSRGYSINEKYLRR